MSDSIHFLSCIRWGILNGVLYVNYIAFAIDAFFGREKRRREKGEPEAGPLDGKGRLKWGNGRWTRGKGKHNVPCVLPLHIHMYIYIYVFVIYIYI